MTDITLKQGQTGSISLNVVNTSSVAFDLTGLTAAFVVSGQGVSLERGFSVATPSLGVGTLSLVQSDYDTLLPGKYNYEVWVYDGNTDSDGDYPTLSGELTITKIPQRSRA
jgi:hypothetical protein